jgi:hypothetical protein
LNAAPCAAALPPAAATEAVTPLEVVDAEPVPPQALRTASEAPPAISPMKVRRLTVALLPVMAADYATRPESTIVLAGSHADRRSVGLVPV